MPKTAYVYILASKTNGTLYTGVTTNLERRMYEHKHHLLDGFTDKYDVTRLVWFTQGEDIQAAISLEKKIKNRNRQWKIDLIEKTNPNWSDLAASWFSGSCDFAQDDRRDFAQDGRRDFTQDARRDFVQDDRKNFVQSDKKNCVQDGKKNFVKDNNKDFAQDDKKDFTQDGRRDFTQDEQKDLAQNNNNKTAPPQSSCAQSQDPQLHQSTRSEQNQ